MTDRLLVDLTPDGRVSVSTWWEGELPGRASEPSELAWTLDADALEDLRWYLEDYLRVPYGVYGDRGDRVVGRLRAWGESIFVALFGTGPAHDAYVRVRERNRDAEVVLRSSSPAVFGLPWELLADPARPTPLVLDGLRIARTLPAEGLGAPFAASGERLRVLMVISRPRGPADVGYRMIARPLLERLEAIRGKVELVVLRPPTLEALDRALVAARADGQPFQIVHFDGHGVLAGRSRRTPGASAPIAYPGSGEGVLTFELPGGGSDNISAAVFAQVIKAAEVPLVVLNACQSGAVGADLEAAVATRLLQEGAASVVAMGYSVYAVAAAEFMVAFYERLFAGDGISQAVGAGRRRLHQRPERPSPKGLIPLADWVVPVHYLRRDVRFPDLEPGARRDVSLDNALDRLRERSADHHADGLEPLGVFVGRDGLFYELEVAARAQRVVLLHGTGGAGKTELAKAFGRWWRDTGGAERPNWVIVQSFEPGSATFGLDGVVSNIGLRVFGADFAHVASSERRGVVEQFLAEHRLLLIWDNFETLFSMPDRTGARPILPHAERDELRGFLQRLATRGRSSIIITSRSDEAWLGELRRIPLSGFSPEEAIEYAEHLLRSHPSASARRATRAFADLLEWLDGHPLAMRLVLPHIASSDPETLLAGLRGRCALPPTLGAEDRTDSLEACVAYSYDQLSPSARRILVALSLLEGIADVTVVAILAKLDQCPERFRGVTAPEWLAVLEEGARFGLLTQLGGGMYAIHPALPSFLANRWRADVAPDYESDRAATEAALVVAYTGLAISLLRRRAEADTSSAFAIVDCHYRSLTLYFGRALDHRLWNRALALGQLLVDFWQVRGMGAEAAVWTDRARLALEGPEGVAPRLDSAAGMLWLIIVGDEAQRASDQHDLDMAQRIHLEIIAMLEQQPITPQQQHHLGVAYHELGRVEQRRGSPDQAEDWYRRALMIAEALGEVSVATIHQLGQLLYVRGRSEEAEALFRSALTHADALGDENSLASIYHSLGNVASRRLAFDEAEDWYRKSLTISEHHRDPHGTASACRGLGLLASRRGLLDEAHDWYTRTLAIDEQLGDRPAIALTYENLAGLADKKGRWDEAAQWFENALTVREDMSDRTGMASIYQQLGVLAFERGLFDRADEWYHKAIAIEEELGDKSGIAGTYHELAVVLQHRGQLDEAEDLYRRVLALEADLGDRRGMALTGAQLASCVEQQGRPLEALDWLVRSATAFDRFPHPESTDIVDYFVRLSRQLGIDTVGQRWTEITGRSLPAEVRTLVVETSLDRPPQEDDAEHA